MIQYYNYKYILAKCYEDEEVRGQFVEFQLAQEYIYIHMYVQFVLERTIISGEIIMYCANFN